MARNGSGTYTLVAGNPVVTGTTISSTTHNSTMSDIANALTTSLAKDGQTVPTANLPMGGYKLTGLGAATIAGDAVRYEQVVTLADIAGTTHAATTKTTPVDADELALADSAATFGLKKLTWANLKATLKTYFDTLYIALVAPGTSGNVLTSNGTAWVSSAPAIELSTQMIHVQEQQASGTVGGASSTGDNIRVLNTVVKNTITGASLATNQITLPAGTYRLWARAPGYSAGAYLRSRIVNVTDATVALLGSNAYAQGLSDAWVIGSFTISAQKVFNITQYFSAGRATDGLGVAVSDSRLEVQSEVMIWKE